MRDQSDQLLTLSRVNFSKYGLLHDQSTLYQVRIQDDIDW